MTIILQFPSPTYKCAAGETLYHTFDDQWVIVQIRSHAALTREAERVHMHWLNGEDYRRKFDDPNFAFLSLRSKSGEGASILVVNETTKWVDEFCHAQVTNRTRALRLFAQLVAEKGWLKNYRWEHGYVFTSDGKVSSVNALPDPLIVNGDFEIAIREGVSLPRTVVVAGHLNLHSSTIVRPPNYLSCQSISVIGCTMENIATRLKAEGNVTIEMSHVTKIADEAVIKGNLIIQDNSQRIDLPRVLRVGEMVKVSKSEISDFGDDTVILGGLDFSGNRIICRYGLDFGGRLIRHGETVRVVEVPSHDKSGRAIEIPEGVSPDALFHGQFKNDTYSCLILDRKRGVTHSVSLLRHEISSKRVMPPASRELEA